ncbi:MAG: hypothetical protein HY042_07040 [Spirochaetia bacterium]|nr:hypothetical protein [Spirochaetia bacterium]
MRAKDIAFRFSYAAAAVVFVWGAQSAWATGSTEKEKPCTQSKATVLEYGLARTGPVELVPIDPSRTAAANLFRPDQYEFIRTTRDIPLESGNWIYIRYRVDGVRAERRPRMRYLVTHPEMGFDDRFPFEFVTGRWKFQLWEGNCLLFSQEFRTYR